MRERQFVSFFASGRLFGIDILVVREIIRNVSFTPVEHAPPAVRGLLNLRGQIITVLDMARALGLESQGGPEGSRCIILKTSDEAGHLLESGQVTDEMQADAVGLLVDSISDVVTVDEADLDPAPANTSSCDSDFTQGVVQLEGNLLTVLALKPLVAQGTGLTPSGV
jgi:purine-binding chemotaxis protein CheW